MPGALCLVAWLSLASTDVVKPREPATPQGAAVPEQGQLLAGLVATTQAINGLKLELTAVACVGLGRGFDVGAAVDHTILPLSGPGSMTAAHVTARKLLTDSGRQSDVARRRTALTLDVSAAWFGSGPAEEGQTDGRLWSGLRDYNAELGFVFSSSALMGFYVKTAVLVSLDLSPPSLGPLQGPAPPFNVGAAVSGEIGTDLSAGLFHGVVGLRVMVHGRTEDERVSLATFVGIAFG